MKGIEIVLILVLVAAGGFALWQVIRRSQKGSACCGAREGAEKPIKPQDTQKSHYAYKITLRIANMMCHQCAIKVQNALNALGDVYAKVNYDTKLAVVYTHDDDTRRLRQAIVNAGYSGEIEQIAHMHEHQ